ncbi:carboxypeptidase-like regulatory domain-containing protein [Bacteroidota bacterium]
MRTGILSILLLISVMPGVLSQPDLTKKISLNVFNGRLEDVLQEISKQGDIELSYSSKKIDLEQRVIIQVTDASIARAFEDLSRQASLEFFIVENHIVVKPARRSKQSEPSGPFHFTLSGYIRDTKSNEALIGATIYLPELEKGTISNEFGFYSLTIPAGRYNFSFSYIGYKTYLWNTDLATNQVIDIQLEEEPALLKEVVIIDMDDQIDLASIRTGNINLEPRSVERMPAFMGEQDIIKSLDLLPGITLQGDGSTLFFVRGGNKDQNRILIDDAPIYNPSHVLGIFSTFIPEAVKDIDIYKGDIPAEFGGRLSSLLDVRTKDGDMNRVIVNGSLGLATAKASVEGPIYRGNSSFFVSGRTSYFKWFILEFNPGIQRFYFTDLNAKLNLKLSPKDRLHVSGYTGKDYFSHGPNAANTSGISWGNLAGTVRWNHLFNDRLFSNTTLYGSKYDYYLLTNVEQNNFWNSRISNFSLKSDFTWYANPDISFKFGAKLSRHLFNPGNYEDGQNRNTNVPIVSPKTGREIVFYASNNHSIGNRLSLRYGLRASVWQNLGEATEYVYDEDYSPVDTLHYKTGQVYNTYFRLEPRMGLTYRFARNSSLKASYARTTQYEQLVTNSISPFTTLEVYLPAGPNILPQLADQFSIGYFQKIPGGNLDLSIEGFYKKMYNQIDYRDNAHMLLNPHVESELRFGQGEAYGFEILLKKYYGRLNGWIGYAYTRSLRKIGGLYGGEVHPAAWDRPHDFSLYVSYNIKERWLVSMNWLYMTGSAFSSPTGFYYYNGYAIPFYEKKNNDRLPDYHRLDVSTELQLSKPSARFQHKLVVSVYNLYGRKNPISVNFNKTLNPEGKPVIPGDLSSPPELVPSMIYLFSFVPSLSYSFTF